MHKFLVVLLCSVALAFGQEASRPVQQVHGVLACFSQKGRTDAFIAPDLAFYVAAGAAPSPFLKPGSFVAEFKGTVTSELRGQYQFSAEVSGELELLVNGSSILKVAGVDAKSDLSKPVRLNRGTNTVAVRFNPRVEGDARFQVLWLSKNWPRPIPVPLDLLGFDERDAALARSSQMRSGLRLVIEYRCARCHLPEHPASPSYDLDAPDFVAIGSRLRPDWMAQWIADPNASGRRSHMPRVFSAADAPAKSRLISAFLATLTAENTKRTDAAAPLSGEELFRELNCAACHEKNDPALLEVAKKFRPGQLAAYLQNPQQHYTCNPMPRFQLTTSEAAALAKFLDPGEPAATPEEQAMDLSEGRKLVQSSGCLNCHRAALENSFSAPPLQRITQSDRGCLSGAPGSPLFQFSAEERQCLNVFLQNFSPDFLTNLAPADFALRETTRLQCNACHDKIEGLPPLKLAAAKLKPEWSERLLAGAVSNKSRPWLNMRMPAFPAAAGGLARGLAALHGIPPTTKAEPPPDSALAEAGAKLVSAAGGFACVACHAVGSFASGQVVESPGVNLAYANERLLPSFFRRWVMNPVAIDATTKMPVYFDNQGRSQLTDLLDGDGEKQIDALWAYLRLGPKMPAPPVP